eukprot:evm.model.scf_2551.3 EVM.evm.TU.scf_2551.3   scf_2551:6255-10419(-)
MAKRDKKEQYHARLCEFLDEYDKCFIVHADNVGSKQFMDIRRGLRPNSVILMGKNTMMKRSIRLYCERSGNKSWEAVLDHLQGNVGLLFTKSDLNEIKAELKKFVVGAPARVGAIAPCDVFVPPGGTGMDPSQTSFFQALGIATKINRGTIEILNQVHLVQEGTKVGGSEATLLAKLGIKPFEYGLKIMQVYENGSLYAPEVLDITDEMLLSKAEVAIRNIASLCLGANYPTIVSLPHSIINAYKNVLAIAVETDYTFPLAEKVKAYLADPSAFAAAAAPAAEEAKEDTKEAAKEEEEEEESDDDMGIGLFGDDDF